MCDIELHYFHFCYSGRGFWGFCGSLQKVQFQDSISLLELKKC
jgi:hypothetical protein